MIAGLSLLLLFVALGHAIGWPSDRGMLTIWLAHVTFCTAYVAVVISSRLRELDHSIEEAAMNLGAAPLKVFFVITLPMIMPAVISGWLLAFTLSLDGLVIASFVSGSGATTLPMLVFSSVRMGVNPEIERPATSSSAWSVLLVYRLVFDGPRRKAASARYPACKTRLNHLKIGTAASGRRHPVAPFSWKTLRWDCLPKTRSSHARLNVPALVQVAAFAIILIGGLDLLIILQYRWPAGAERIHTPQRSDLGT